MTKRPSVNDALKGSMPERIEGLPLRYGQEAFDLGGGLVEVRGRCYVTKSHSVSGWPGCVAHAQGDDSGCAARHTHRGQGVLDQRYQPAWLVQAASRRRRCLGKR
jgi:hypothetical protein